MNNPRYTYICWDWSSNPNQDGLDMLDECDNERDAKEYSFYLKVEIPQAKDTSGVCVGVVPCKKNNK